MVHSVLVMIPPEFVQVFKILEKLGLEESKKWKDKREKGKRTRETGDRKKGLGKVRAERSEASEGQTRLCDNTSLTFLITKFAHTNR